MAYHVYSSNISKRRAAFTRVNTSKDTAEMAGTRARCNFCSFVDDKLQP